MNKLLLLSLIFQLPLSMSFISMPLSKVRITLLKAICVKQNNTDLHYFLIRQQVNLWKINLN
ncbi:hypothetical protein [Candidatus Williamhamiltonella defendens]|uniref:hypothetical protein n=1 Tax=Candidatus Williamhamiltonella defendens TaxID=138072 RepID=UPI00130EA2E3|nr:hypothetical protein [Candidatus Hamiltonella defensa]